MITPNQLRAKAKKIRELAKYASGKNYYDEMGQASALEAEAKALDSRIAENESRRKKLVAKVKIGQKQLGLDDDTYRDLLETVTGKRSASKLKVWELENVVKRLTEAGFKPSGPKRAGTRKQADDNQSKKIRSLWIQLHNAKKVRDPSEKALINWVKGQFKNSKGIEVIQWLSVYQKSQLIESLKQWLNR